MPAPSMAPRFGVANGGEREGEGQSGEEVEAAPSDCGSELSMIDEGGEECEETEARPSSEEQGCAPSLEVGPTRGALCSDVATRRIKHPSSFRAFCWACRHVPLHATLKAVATFSIMIVLGIIVSPEPLAELAQSSCL